MIDLHEPQRYERIIDVTLFLTKGRAFFGESI